MILSSLGRIFFAQVTFPCLVFTNNYLKQLKYENNIIILPVYRCPFAAGL
jgi:hypothetical protein